MGVLNDIGLKYKTDKSTLFHGYLDFYEKHLPNRSFSGRLCEIGVMDGASAKMWREYYPLAEIICLDIHLRIKHIEGVKLMEMDATNIIDLDYLGSMDIWIDDGSHMTSDQQVTFNYAYYNLLNSGGFYVMEDLHTSFMPNYINTPKTTYDMLREEFIYSSDYEYARLGEDKTDSVTMVIPKI